MEQTGQLACILSSACLGLLQCYCGMRSFYPYPRNGEAVPMDLLRSMPPLEPEAALCHLLKGAWIQHNRWVPDLPSTHCPLTVPGMPSVSPPSALNDLPPTSCSPPTPRPLCWPSLFRTFYCGMGPIAAQGGRHNSLLLPSLLACHRCAYGIFACVSSNARLRLHCKLLTVIGNQQQTKLCPSYHKASEWPLWETGQIFGELQQVSSLLLKSHSQEIIFSATRLQQIHLFYINYFHFLLTSSSCSGNVVPNILIIVKI